LAVGDYWSSVRARLSNPGIDHRLSQIDEDGAAKLLERVFPLLISNAQAGASVSRLARIVHAWLKLTGADFDTALNDSTLFPPPIRCSSTLRTAITAAVA
jgi:mannitol-1-phosphate/altronate dehydrogenase